MGNSYARRQFEFFERSSPSDWDSLLLEHGMPHIYQCSAFADHFPYLEEGYRYFPRYLYVADSGLVVGQCLIGVSKRNTALWFFGPTVRDSHAAFYNDIVVQMISYLRRQGILAVDLASTQIFYEQSIFTDGDIPYSYICETCFVDLEKDADEIFHSFDGSVRKNVRKCIEAGVTVEITNDMSRIPLYLEMLSSFRRKRGFPLPSFHPNSTSMKLFSRESTSMDIAIASVAGLPVAAMGYVTFGKLVTEIAAAESDEYCRLKLPANDLIKVSAVETYKSRGMKYYDITGGRKHSEDPKQRNIDRFKRKFGKRLAEYQRIERQYLSEGPFRHKVQVNVLRAKETLDRLSRVPSAVIRRVRRYYAQRPTRR